jgi:hypothetical protein
MSEDEIIPAVSMAKNVDLRNKQEVDEYFAYLNREFPQIVEAIEVMGVPLQNYLLALQAIHQQASTSTTSTQIFL